MRRIALLLVAVATVAGVVAFAALASGHADEEAAPIFGVKIPPGHRDWRLISVAHEEGNLNDLRAILGNDEAIKAYREGKLPFPDGTIIARLAWSYVASEENNSKLATLSSPATHLSTTNEVIDSISSLEPLGINAQHQFWRFAIAVQFKRTRQVLFNDNQIHRRTYGNDSCIRRNDESGPDQQSRRRF